MKRAIIAAVLTAALTTAPALACSEGLLNDGAPQLANWPTAHFTEYVAKQRLEEEKAAKAKKEEEARQKAKCEDETPVEYIGNFEITYYTSSGTRTYTGTVPEVGTAGVDPDVIPLGSTIYIEYGDGSIRECHAEDVGGAVKGNIIDVWQPDEATCWELGRQEAKVYIERRK